MSYRITLRSNPRLLVVPVLVLAALTLGYLLLTVSVVVGIVALAVSGYLAYVMIRFVTKQLKCVVEVTDEALILDLYGEEKVTAPWTEVTYAGCATDTRRRRVLFLYREGEDKLLVIPDEFERFDAIADEVAAHIGSSTSERAFQRLSLGPGETIKERLRAQLRGPHRDDQGAAPEG